MNINTFNDREFITGTGENLSAGGSIVVELDGTFADRMQYLLKETTGSPSGYDLAFRVYTNRNRNTQVAGDESIESGKSGQTSGTVDLPGRWLELVIINNDNSNAGTIDLSAKTVKEGNA